MKRKLSLNKRKIIIDYLLNFIGNFSLTVSLQILLYPKIAMTTSSSFFGSFVFIMSIINFLIMITGSTLGILFLRNHANQKEKNQEVNFYRQIMLLLILLLIVYGFLFYFYTYFLNENKILKDNIVYIICIIILSSLKVLAQSWFRSFLAYKEIFIVNFTQTLIYISLYFINFDMSRLFLYLLLIEVLCLIVTFSMVKKKEVFLPKLRTELKLSYTLNNYMFLLGTSLSITILSYVDRWFIEYNFTSRDLAIYFASNVSGSIVLFPIGILSTIILSYLAQEKNIDKLNIKVINVICIISPVTLLIITFFFSPMLLKLLYPAYSNEALTYLYILNIGYSFAVVDYILRSFLVRFQSLKVKLYIDIAIIVICIILNLVLLTFFQVLGIVIATTLTLMIKSLLYYLAFRTLLKSKS